MPGSPAEQEPVAFRKPTSVVLLDLSKKELDTQRHNRSRTGWLRDRIAEYLGDQVIANIVESPITSEVIDVFSLALTELFSNADGEAPQSRGKGQQRRFTRVSVEARRGKLRVSIGDTEPTISDDGRTMSPDPEDRGGWGRHMLRTLGVELSLRSLEEEQDDGTRKFVYADIPVPLKSPSDNLV